MRISLWALGLGIVGGDLEPVGQADTGLLDAMGRDDGRSAEQEQGRAKDDPDGEQARSHERPA
jgi:hypothetical protein